MCDVLCDALAFRWRSLPMQQQQKQHCSCWQQWQATAARLAWGSWRSSRNCWQQLLMLLPAGTLAAAVLRQQHLLKLGTQRQQPQQHWSCYITFRLQRKLGSSCASCCCRNHKAATAAAAAQGWRGCGPAACSPANHLQLQQMAQPSQPHRCVVESSNISGLSPYRLVTVSMPGLIYPVSRRVTPYPPGYLHITPGISISCRVTPYRAR